MSRAAGPSGVWILLKFLMTGSTALTSYTSEYGMSPPGWDTPEGPSECVWLGTHLGPLSVAQLDQVNRQPNYDVQAEELQHGNCRSGIELGDEHYKRTIPHSLRIEPSLVSVDNCSHVDFCRGSCPISPGICRVLALSRGRGHGRAKSGLSALMATFRNIIGHGTACLLTLTYQYMSISIWEITRIVLVPRAGSGICETARWPSAPTCR